MSSAELVATIQRHDAAVVALMEKVLVDGIACREEHEAVDAAARELARAAVKCAQNVHDGLIEYVDIDAILAGKEPSR